MLSLKISSVTFLFISLSVLTLHGTSHHIRHQQTVQTFIEKCICFPGNLTKLNHFVLLVYKWSTLQNNTCFEMSVFQENK